MKKLNVSLSGFTLIEVLFASGILVTCLCEILLTYSNMFIAADLMRDFTLVNNAMQAKMEDVKRENFAKLTDNRTGLFILTDYGLPSTIESMGRIEVTEKFDNNNYTGNYADRLTKVRLIASFKSRGRIIGEDKNLDGDLDLPPPEPGEDTFLANGRLDSPVEIVTLIANITK